MPQAVLFGGALDGCRITLTGNRLPAVLVAGSELAVDAYELRGGRYVEARLSAGLSRADERAWMLRDGMRLVAAVVARSQRARAPWRSSGLMRLLSMKDEA